MSKTGDWNDLIDRIETIAEACGYDTATDDVGVYLRHDRPAGPGYFDPSTDLNTVIVACQKLGLEEFSLDYWAAVEDQEEFWRCTIELLDGTTRMGLHKDLTMAAFEALHSVAVAVLAENKEVKE